MTTKKKKKRQLGLLKILFFRVTVKDCPYLYLLSGRGLSLRGGGEALRSESESDTGLRGREAEEEGREVVQLWTTGEDRGLGRVDTPDRALQSQTNIYSFLNVKVSVVIAVHREDIYSKW